MATTNFRILNPILATTREVAEVVNGAMNGKLNCTGEFTITASATTTTVTEPRAGKESVILLSPTTSNAAAAIGTTYISSKANGSFVVTHASNAQTDRDFDYVVIG